MKDVKFSMSSSFCSDLYRIPVSIDYLPVFFRMYPMVVPETSNVQANIDIYMDLYLRKH